MNYLELLLIIISLILAINFLQNFSFEAILFNKPTFQLQNVQLEMIKTTSRFFAILGFLSLNFYPLLAKPSDNLTLSSTTLFDPVNPSDTFALHVNCGGNRMVQHGVTFEKDQYYVGNGKKYENTRITDIKNTTDDALYLTERSVKEGEDTFGYEVTVPNGIYEVKLHFAEIFWGATGGGTGGAGKRNFSVALENQWLLSNYDIAADVGSMTAVVKVFTVAVADGTFNLDLFGNKDQPKLSAFELIYKNATTAQDTQPYTWEEKATSPTEKLEPQCVQVNDKILSISGFTKGYKIINETDIYDPATNTWSKGIPIPLGVTHGATAFINGEIWIIGGYSGDDPGVGTAKVQIYNVAEDNWREGPALPKQRGGGAAAYYDGKLHFFGGFYPDRQTNSGDHFVLDFSALDQGWQEDTPMPNPRGHLSAAVINGTIYAIGGQHGHDGEIVDQKSVHAYNPATRQWTEKQALPYARSHFEPGTLVYNDQVIIVGGRRGEHYFYNRVTAYDPETDIWREIGKLPAKMVGPSSKIINDQLIITNGGLNGDYNPTDRTWSTPFELNRPNLSVENIEDSPRFIEVYPNPVANMLRLKLNDNADNTPIDINLISTLGQQVLHKKIKDTNLSTTQTLDVSGLQDGVYFVTITQGKSKNSFKIVKK